jgi:hypothetical protein
MVTWCGTHNQDLKEFMTFDATPPWLADKTSQAFQLHGHLCTLYFFSLFWGHVFFAFHNLGTFCRSELLKLV